MSTRRLLVKTAEQIAQLWAGDDLIRTYPVSTALNGTGVIPGSQCTPTGKLRIEQKVGEGLPLGSVLKGRQPTGQVWSPEPWNALASSQEDLILTRVLWLGGIDHENANTRERMIYLHGTNQEKQLGKPVSHGCIRFANSDIVEIFELLNEGDLVEVV